MTKEEIFAIYREYGAVWLFDYRGDPKAPHAALASGFCSDTYINSAPVMSDPRMVRLLARHLARLTERNVSGVEWVLGSAYGSIVFSYEVARQLNARHAFVKKDSTDPKRLLWGEVIIPEGARILQCEELITTFGTTLKVRRAVQERNPEPVFFLPDVATVIYRPPKLLATALIDVIALASEEMKVWKQEECPLCLRDSKPLRPNDENWIRLMGQRLR